MNDELNIILFKLEPQVLRAQGSLYPQSQKLMALSAFLFYGEQRSRYRSR